MAPKHKNGLFNRPSTIIGSDVPLPSPKSLRPASAAVMAKRIVHETAFRPNGTNLKPATFHPTIGRYPEWTAGRPKTAVRKRFVPDAIAERPSFKMTHNKKSTPCPSVVLNKRNIRA